MKLIDKVRELISKPFIVETLITVGLNGSDTSTTSRPLSHLEREMAQALIRADEVSKRFKPNDMIDEVWLDGWNQAMVNIRKALDNK